MKVNYLLAACAHRAETTDSTGTKGRTVLRKHLKELLKTDTSVLAQLTLVRALPLTRGPDSEEYWDVEDLLAQARCPIKILDVPDRLFSYSSWITAALEYRDCFDYYILIEDDYYPVLPNFVDTLVGLHNKLLPSGGFLCSFKANGHAAVSNGIVDASTFLGALEGRADPVADISSGAQELFSKVFFGDHLADYTNDFRVLFFDKGTGIVEQYHKRYSRPQTDLINPIQYLSTAPGEEFPPSPWSGTITLTPSSFSSPQHSLKSLLHVTAPITTSPDGDNLRGEPRWERNVLDAYLHSGRCVHTTVPIWRSTFPKPMNLHDGYNPDWAESSILTTYGVPQNPHITQRAGFYIVQYLDAPNAPEEKERFLKYDREKPGSIVATCNFRTWEYLDRLKKSLGEENVRYVQGPAVPFTEDAADNFGQPLLLWLYRNFWYCAQEDPGGMKQLFERVADYMKNDQALRFGIIIGAWDPGAHPDIQATGRQWVLGFEFMKSLLPYSDRVDVYSKLHWKEVLDLLSRTHLVISPPEPLGGPPYEGAMFGIPVVVGEYNPFQNRDGSPFFPELLMSEKRKAGGHFLDCIERLYHEHDFYRRHGDAYRAYIREHATYAAYLRQIDALVAERGWA